MEKKFNRVDRTGSIQERANLIADATKQLPWFYLKGPETLDFLFFLTYQRFLLRFPTGVFSSWKASLDALPQQKPTFWDFLEHYFEDLIDAHRIKSIKDFEAKPDLLAFMESIEGAAYALSDEEYAEFFEYFLIVKMGGDFLNPIFPAPLGKVMAGLFELEPNAIVQNPYAGRGTLIPYLPKNCIYRGKPEDPMDVAILSLRMLVHGFLKEKISKVGALERSMEKAAISICFPPFDKEYVAFPPRDGESPEDIPERLIGELLRGVSKTGKVMLVTNDRFLTGSSKASEVLQKTLVNSGYLTTIILLPETLFPFGAIHCSLVVLDKEKEKNGPVTFFKSVNVNKDSSRRDLEQLDVEGTIQKFREKRFGPDVVEIPLERITDWGYKLSPVKAMVERIVRQEEDQMEPGVQLVDLGNLLDRISPVQSPVVGLARLTIADINRSEPLNRLTVEDILKLELVNEDQKGYLRLALDQPTLLVPRIGSKARPTIVDPREQAVAIHSNVLCFRQSSTAINLEYLVLELHSSFVQKQLELIQSNLVLPSISYREYLSLKIRVPELRQQVRRVEDYKAASMTSKLEQLRLHQKMLGLEDSEHQILAVLGHEVRPLLASVRARARLTRMYIEDKEAVSETVSINHKIGSRPQSPTVHEAYELIEKDLDRWADLFESLEALMKSEKSKMTFTEVDVFEFITQLSKELSQPTDNFEIACYRDMGLEGNQIAPTVMIDKSLLRQAFENLVRNAREHAFDKEEGENKLLFFLSYVRKSEGILVVKIDVLNNGRPFHPDFSFEKFTEMGASHGKTKGTGIGGFLIKRIIENHGGVFRLLEPRELVDSLMRMAVGKFKEDFQAEFGSRQFNVAFTIELPFQPETHDNLD